MILTATVAAATIADNTDAMNISTTTMTSVSGVLISCCLCGVLIEPNPCNTCAMCLASQSDVTRGISSEATMHQCRGCHRWHAGGNNGTTDVNAGKWVSADLESRELMSLCLSKVSGLSNKNKKEQNGGLRLVDAVWIWTEPHCMRLKVRLTVQREVHSGTVLQQSLVVTFIIRNMQCMDCQAVYRQGSWKSLVQVRQRVSHKRTFLYLEQLILKHGAHRGCLSIEAFRDGMDFYFPDKQKAARFLSFLENVVPMKTKTSKKLIGTDDKNNVCKFFITNL
jgi:nonsense-mediated mRNA decay protein 3